MSDQPTLNKISTLHPKLRDEALLIYNEINAALTGRAKVRFTFTLRSFEEQQAIYNQGRTTPGNIVTNAKPGSSYHNYGLAIDIALLIDGKDISWDTKADWDGDKQSDWMECVVIFKRHGWKWGGDWVSFKDMPHFEKTFGYDWRQLLEKYNNKDFIPGTKYVNI
jgi:peptidoglycan LD-endopeptidase CwlK